MASVQEKRCEIVCKLFAMHANSTNNDMVLVCCFLLASFFSGCEHQISMLIALFTKVKTGCVRNCIMLKQFPNENVKQLKHLVIRMFCIVYCVMYDIVRFTNDTSECDIVLNFATFPLGAFSNRIRLCVGVCVHVCVHVCNRKQAVTC